MGAYRTASSRGGVGVTALRAYLAVLAGGEPSSSLLELRPMFRDGGAAPERTFVPVAELDRVERRARALANVRNVYVGVAPRTRPEGHAGAVERVWTLWADVDTEDALARLQAFRPAPGIVVCSGSGAHAYWPMLEPLTPVQAQRANRRLALALGADMAATDAARILRPPGTLNHKSTRQARWVTDQKPGLRPRRSGRSARRSPSFGLIAITSGSAGCSGGWRA
jgi:RepB DNA-primase from phage plasmid